MTLGEYDTKIPDSKNIALCRTRFEKIVKASRRFDLCIRDIYGGRNIAEIPRPDQTRIGEGSHTKDEVESEPDINRI
jgi:hypothetical protein